MLKMTNSTLRKKIHGCIDELDDRYLQIIYSYLKDFTPEEYVIDDEELAILNERSAQYKSGKVKGYTLEEVNKKLQTKTRK
jgi:hypothetical protein